MRARYSAYAVDDLDYVWQTWHPRTRPEELTPDAGLTWTGLEIVDTVDGSTPATSRVRSNSARTTVQNQTKRDAA